MGDTVKCPFCGAEKGDLWDVFDDIGQSEADVQCDECEREYTIIQHVLVSYSTIPDVTFEGFLNEHPDIKEKYEAQKSRMKDVIKSDRNLTGARL